ncbi:MAG: M28 family peptidase [Taibaiella sp.]|nr:M28 family peptidase [Taibaiella sp.]
MSSRLKSFVIFLASVTVPAIVCGQKKAAKKTAGSVRADITYLASDELAGRRTGTEGERKAADYIEARYKKLKIAPYNGNYRYPFHFTYGREIAATTRISVNNKPLLMETDAFPLPFSATKHVTSDVLPDVTEQGNIWMMPLFTDAEQAKDPHFEAEKHMYEKAKEAKNGGASGILFYDNYGSTYEPEFSRHSEYDPLELPVAYLKNSAWKKYVQENKLKGGVPVDMDIAINKSERTGNNLAAYIDNKAPYTVIIGAHYDHLGFGEDGNSLHANAVKQHQIHHGADDNASGTAALMEVAKWVKNHKMRHYNYLFLHFSGEELGLFGSKAFIKDQKIDSSHTAYMLNMDMVGRLNDSTRALTVGGVGTSPEWGEVVNMGKEKFKIVIDSTGSGPSDHTSFYYAGIPVLFLFTGTHKDYHKPTDIAANINYPGEVDVINYTEQIIARMDKLNKKPVYTVTKQSAIGKTRFKVTLGIMPDYTYQEGGVRADGVTDGRPAAKAGIKAGDVIVQLGDYQVSSMQSYMEALGKFTPGDNTTVKIKRDGKEMSLPLEFSPAKK